MVPAFTWFFRFSTPAGSSPTLGCQRSLLRRQYWSPTVRMAWWRSFLSMTQLCMPLSSAAGLSVQQPCFLYHVPRVFSPGKSSSFYPFVCLFNQLCWSLGTRLSGSLSSPLEPATPSGSYVLVCLRWYIGPHRTTTPRSQVLRGVSSPGVFLRISPVSFLQASSSGGPRFGGFLPTGSCLFSSGNSYTA